MAMMLRLMGARSVVITGVREGNFYTNVVLDRGMDAPSFVKVKCAGGQRPGTGDVFASVAAGALLRGASLKEKDISILENPSLCISNEVLEEKAVLTFRSGLLLCVESRDRETGLV